MSDAKSTETKPAEKKAQTAQGKQPKKKGGGKTIFFMVIVGCLVPFGLPTLVVCLGLIPTVVALFTDTDENRSGLATIGYLNLAGVLPFLIELWQHGQTMDVAMRIVRDPYSWLIMFGSAGIGHLILYAVPPMIASIILINAESRLKVLREGVQQLEAIWGPDVGTSTPIENIRKSKGV